MKSKIEYRILQKGISKRCPFSAKTGKNNEKKEVFKKRLTRFLSNNTMTSVKRFTNNGGKEKRMRKIHMGSTLMEVPAIAVGCMRLNSLDQTEADRFVCEAVEQEAVFFDHADIYGNGSCEEIFGEVLSVHPGLREQIVLQSKAGIIPGKCYNNSAEYLIQSVDGILKRLQTEYLDIFLIHRPDVLASPEEVAKAFDTLHQSGKVKYFGVSNHRRSQLELLQKYMDQPLMIDQLQLSLTNATLIQSGIEANMLSDGAVDRDGGVLDYCRMQNITIQTWSPFQYGMIEGTFLGNPKYPELNKELLILAEKYHTTNTAIAAAWILNHPANMQMICGSTKIGRLKEVIDATHLTLEREEWYRLYLSAGHMLP